MMPHAHKLWSVLYVKERVRVCVYVFCLPVCVLVLCLSFRQETRAVLPGMMGSDVNGELSDVLMEGQRASIPSNPVCRDTASLSLSPLGWLYCPA